MSKEGQIQTIQQYTLDGDETPSHGVYSVIAAVENCSPLDLSPLAEAIDPDALDVLLARESGTDRVSFEYQGYDVIATPNEIRVG